MPPALISIIRSFHDSCSFHDSISASFLLPDIAFDLIDARNGRRQGCCMPPVLLNIFMWAVFQLWSRAVKEFDEFRVRLCHGSGGALLFKKGGDCELSVNVSFLTIFALFASTHGGALHALTPFMAISSSFGLKFNLGKTKFITLSGDISLQDRCPLRICCGENEHVSEFLYLGSIASTDDPCHLDGMHQTQCPQLSDRVFSAGNLSASHRDIGFYSLCFFTGTTDISPRQLYALNFSSTKFSPMVVVCNSVHKYSTEIIIGLFE